MQISDKILRQKHPTLTWFRALDLAAFRFLAQHGRRHSQKRSGFL
jgi:hypothetical protein